MIKVQHMLTTMHTWAVLRGSAKGDDVPEREDVTNGCRVWGGAHLHPEPQVHHHGPAVWRVRPHDTRMASFPLWLAGTATSMIFVATNTCLLQQTRVRVFGSTNTCLWRQYKSFVTTQLLSRQTWFCRNKRFVTTSILLSRQTHVILVAAPANDIPLQLNPFPFYISRLSITSSACFL